MTKAPRLFYSYNIYVQPYRSAYRPDRTGHEVAPVRSGGADADAVQNVNNNEANHP